MQGLPRPCFINMQEECSLPHICMQEGVGVIKRDQCSALPHPYLSF